MACSVHYRVVVKILACHHCSEKLRAQISSQDTCPQDWSSEVFSGCPPYKRSEFLPSPTFLPPTPPRFNFDESHPLTGSLFSPWPPVSCGYFLLCCRKLLSPLCADKLEHFPTYINCLRGSPPFPPLPAMFQRLLFNAKYDAQSYSYGFKQNWRWVIRSLDLWSAKISWRL